MFRLIDTHAHLEEIEGLEQVLAGAKSAQVMAVIAVGSDAASNERVRQFSQTYRGFVYPALGLHPWRINGASLDRDLESIESHIGQAVAVGEVGLDYHKKVRVVAEKDLQKHVFREVLQIAKRHQKPVIVHSRYAWRDALDLVVEAQLEEAVFHWYTGTSSVLRDIIARGYFLSANPAIEYHEEHRRAVREVPLERLLLETDSPVVYRGSEAEYQSSPADVLRVLRGVAKLRGIDEAQVAEVTTDNALGLFHIRD